MYSSKIFSKCRQLWNHHNTLLEYFCHPKKFTHIYLQSILIPISAPGDYCFLSRFIFKEILYNGIIQDVVFSVWLFSLR